MMWDKVALQYAKLFIDTLNKHRIMDSAVV